MKKTAKKPLTARVTFLEMTQRHVTAVPPPGGMMLALLRAENCPVHFYRYLYEQVGRSHHWQVRRKQSDEVVREIIRSEKTLLHVFYVDGCPAGFAETSLRGLPQQAEIIYFGLMPDYQGRGLARFFLRGVIAAAWGQDPGKLVLQTNSLDSPRALQLYQKEGFAPVGTKDVVIEPWPDE